MSKSTAEETTATQANGVEFAHHLAVGGMELVSDFCRSAGLCADLAGGWIAKLQTEHCPPLGVHLNVGVTMRKPSAGRLGEHIPAAGRRRWKRYDAGPRDRFACPGCSKGWKANFPSLAGCGKELLAPPVSSPRQVEASGSS